MKSFAILPSCFRALRWGWMAAVLALAGAVVPAQAARMAPGTGKMLANAELIQAIPQVRTGDVTYAQVNSAWLKKFYERYRADLSRMGVVKWDQRFDCRRFAGMYTELAQSEFFQESFHSSEPAHTLALGPVWYLRDNGKGGHAIIVAFTERGRLFIDPQTGQEVELSTREVASIYLAVI